MSFLGLSQADKVLDIAEKSTSGIVKGIDALIFTDEEKSEAGQKVTDSHIELMKVLTDENTARAITRRLLAVGFCGIYLLEHVVSAVLWKYDVKWAEHIFNSASNLNNVILAIVVFYFGYYGIKAVTKK